MTAYREPLGEAQDESRGNIIPDTKGKEKVDDTEATTPIIEKAKAIVSNSYDIES